MADNGEAISVSEQPLTAGSSSSAKKPRGRPRGSKNKPKPPMSITKHKDSSSSMNLVVIEISPGNDVVDSLLHFARTRHVGLSVLSGSGSVSDVTLRHPMSPSTSMSLHGPFSILSFSACFLPHMTSFGSSSSSFGISLAAPHGQVYGGIVCGKVTAASLVIIIAATFTNPAFYRLPSEAAEDKDIDMEKSAIIAAEEYPAVVTVTTSATPLSIVYNTQSPPDHAMAWQRTSY